MSELKHFKKTDSIEKITETLKSDGALVIDNILTEKFVNQLRKETDPYMEATNNGQDGFGGRLLLVLVALCLDQKNAEN